ncbi:hypothetical protein ACLOJK_040933 [Asimina triloba]
MVLPIIAMILVIFVRSFISVFCLGRLGSLELASGALAIGFTNISGYSVLFGLAYGLGPVCSPAYGINKPMMYCAMAALILDVPLNFLMVFVLKLGVPGVAIAAEFGDLNMVLLLAGYLYFSKASMFTWKGVGNELGSGTSYNARLAAIVALGCSVLFSIFNVIWMTVLSQQWALIFTHDSSVLALAASAMPIMGFSQLGNGLQTTGCGVLRASLNVSAQL